MKAHEWRVVDPSCPYTSAVVALVDFVSVNGGCVRGL